jgi:two-component system cell cycle response regulator
VEDDPLPEDKPVDVLVVEDDAAVRAVLETAVRQLGYRVRSASDGLEAWGMQQRRPADIILSDWQMPAMDGAELCRRTRAAQTDGAYTYFIFLTSFADKQHFLGGMEAGADDYQAKPVDLDELEARLTSASRVVGLYRLLAQKNAVLRRDSQVALRMARSDALTGLPNRFAFDEDMAVLWSHAKRYRNRYAVAMCDVDHFKAYNDGFGHVAGDEALRRIARSVRETLRQSDTVYRYGGEEFVVLLPEQSLDEATRAVSRLRQAVERLAIPMPDCAGVLTISCGVAALDLEADTLPESWLRRADVALYGAKATGRNRVEIAHSPRH